MNEIVSEFVAIRIGKAFFVLKKKNGESLCYTHMTENLKWPNTALQVYFMLFD